MRILIVDSDNFFATVLKQSLEKVSSQIQVTMHGEFASALAKLQDSNPPIELVLVSRESSTGTEGLNLLEQIRKDPKISQTQVVLMSSSWGKADFAKHQKTASGANAYHQKSAKPAELIATIEGVTGSKFNAAPKNAVPAASAPAASIEVKLQEAGDILTGFSDMRQGIELNEPINLFAGMEQASKVAAPPVATPPPVIETPPSSEGISVAFEIAPAPAPTVALTETIQAIELSPPTTAAAPAPAAPVPVASAPAMELDLGTEVAPPPEKVEFSALLNEPVPNATNVESASEEEAARDLPYLFSGTSQITAERHRPDVSRILKENAGGYSPSPNDDVEALKKYLMMREQDISVLTVQLNYAKEELTKAEELIRKLTHENEEFFHQMADLKKKVEERDQQLQFAGKNMQGEVEDLSHELKSKIGRIKYLEDKLEDSGNQYEKLKDRVRLDIRKIRVREKELESKLEILKKDSETLIASRENKILELKRKIDLLEFNYDTLQDKNLHEKDKVTAYLEKIEKIEKVLRLAVGVVTAESGSENTENKQSGDSTESTTESKNKQYRVA